ncbi:MAG: hypothetical protein J0I06_15315 [Planctomycetes bacterium]|nr:hypothetical protein [Planctomycetota bacterium]
MRTEAFLPKTPSRARTGGYVTSDGGCCSFHKAVCTEDAHGYLTIEAEGDDCYFELRRVLEQSRTGRVDDVLGAEYPFYPEQFADADTFADSGLIVCGRHLNVADVRATFTEHDPARGLLFVELTVFAESEDGGARGEFEVWLACEYREDERPVGEE